ncbi:hypothetical protein [Mangrovibacterium marinum]|nr:hypothetical protein [Mangrovibacterium marinum]
MNGLAEVWPQDSLVMVADSAKALPDTLKKEGRMNGLTRFVYDRIVSEKKDSSKLVAKAYNLEQLNGKRIKSIKIKQLDIFGPTFDDTARVSDVGVEKLANKVHTRTNERIIQKSILLDVDDKLDVEKVYDNERIIRLLPFIKDVRFMAEADPLDTSMVNLTVVTKDVFAFGMRARFRSVDSGELEMYNQNIWGVGHQISAMAVSSLDEEPNLGFEGSYSINNIRGHFVNLTLGYADNYRREGILFDAEKQFLRSSTLWGGGMTFLRLYRTDRFYENEAILVDSLNYRSFDLWSGYSFKLSDDPSGDLRLILAGRYRNLQFYERPDPGPDNNQYFGNSNFFLGSVSLSKRQYIRDHHILGYGITEDIPKGFLHEFVLGFDQNEKADRWYSHLYFSSGNLIRYKPSYMFLSAGIGSFFNSNRAEQGQLELNWNYISRQFGLGAQTARQFLKIRYVYGFNRFDQETLSLKNRYGIRGFYSDIPRGQQRLVLSAETVIFQRKSILNFNFAFFGFADLGIVGSAHKPVFGGDYYTGVGGGIRLRNESLIFRTIQLRLAFYPGHPGDSSFMGFSLREIGGTDFYSFQPRKPEPLQFK